MRTGVATALSGFLVVALLAVAAAAPGGELAPTTIDRTLACSTLKGDAGRRVVGVAAAPRSQHNKAMLGVFLYGRTEDENRPLVHVFQPGPGSPPGVHGMWIDVERCRTVPHRFLLSRSGLPGTLNQLFVEERCSAGRTILVRVRATFAPWKGWQKLVDPAGPPDLPNVDKARGKPVSASIAVRASGRALAYTMFDSRGLTRTVTAGRPRCRLG
jgi:hypothetical protein